MRFFVLILFLFFPSKAFSTNLTPLEISLKKKQIQEKNKSSEVDIKKIEVLDQKISDTNQVSLIYCKVSVERKWTQNYSYRKKKKGQIDRLNYIIFDNNQDLKECKSYNPQKEKYWETKVLSSSAVSAKEYENYWLGRLIKSNKKFPLPFGQKVIIKLPRVDNPMKSSEVNTILKKSDLIRYCIGGNSVSYNSNRKSIYSVNFFLTEIGNNKVVTGYCRNSSGNISEHGFEVIPVSNGKFSRDDIKNFSFNTLVEVKTLIENKNKVKKESEIAIKEKEEKKRIAIKEKERKKRNIIILQRESYFQVTRTICS